MSDMNRQQQLTVLDGKIIETESLVLRWERKRRLEDRVRDLMRIDDEIDIANATLIGYRAQREALAGSDSADVDIVAEIALKMSEHFRKPHVRFPQRRGADGELGNFVVRRPALVVLVSDRKLPPAEHAIRHHRYAKTSDEELLRRCWLLAGPDGRNVPTSADNAQRLAAELIADGIAAEVITVESAFDANESYRKTAAALTAALTQFAPAQIAVDCTGGTKLMTLGAALAAADAGVQIEFLDANALGRDARPDKRAGGTARLVDGVRG